MYQLTIYVDKPAPGGPWWGASKLGGEDDPTGHAFISLSRVKENGRVRKRFYGFYPLGAVVGWNSVGPEDTIAGRKDFFKKVAGRLRDDSAHPYNDRKAYPITRTQYIGILLFVRTWRNGRPNYILATRNCATFARCAARQWGISLPVQWAFFDSPATLKL